MPNHPYIEFENTPAWATLERAIVELEENQDLKLTELHEYVVGYICKQLADKKLLTQSAIEPKNL